MPSRLGAKFDAMPGGSIWRWLGAVCLFGLLIVAFKPDFEWAPPQIITIAASEVSKGEGHSFTVPLSRKWWSAITFDNSQEAYASRVALYEDGKPLGPAHSLHKAIIDTGGGRFSCWGYLHQGYLLFSTSDNSDPRTNGRNYTIRAPRNLPNLLIVLLAFPLAIFLLQRVIIGRRWLLPTQALVIIVVCLIWLHVLNGFAAYFPDSGTYYHWWSIVPLGYPFFLGLVGSLTLVPPVQLCLLGAALVLLCAAINRISAAASLTALLLLISSTQMFYGEFWLLSEALFVPVLLVNIAAAIFLVTDPDRKIWPVLIAVSAAAIMFIRPAGYFAPLGIVFLMIALRSHFRHLAKWLLVPFLACIVLTNLTNHVVRGGGMQSQVGRVLFPHVAFLFDPSYSSEKDRSVAIAIDAAIAPHRATYEKKTRIAERYHFSTNDYNARLSSIEQAIVRERNSTRAQLKLHMELLRDIDKLYLDLFLRTIYARPVDYLATVFEQLYGAWTFCIVSFYPLEQTLDAEGPQLQGRVEHLKAYNVPLPERALLPNPENFSGFAKSSLLALNDAYLRVQIERWLVFLAGALSLLFVLLAMARPSSPRQVALGYCGVMIHASIMLTCFTTVFIRRYAAPVDPVLLVFGAIAADGALLWLKQRIEHRFAAPAPAPG